MNKKESHIAPEHISLSDKMIPTSILIVPGTWKSRCHEILNAD